MKKKFLIILLIFCSFLAFGITGSGKYCIRCPTCHEAHMNGLGDDGYARRRDDMPRENKGDYVLIWYTCDHGHTFQVECK